MGRASWIVLTVSALSLFSRPVVAAGPVPLETRTRAVALFKNGLGFVTREAVLPARPGTLLVEGLPVPVHGTFWAWLPGRPEGLREIRAFERRVPERMTASSLAELLEANVGRVVELGLGGNESVKGKLLKVEAPPGAAPSGWRESLRPGPPPATLVLLETAKGTVAVDRSRVQRVDGDPGLWTEFERERRGAALQFDVAGQGGDRVRIEYLARGITWAPSYALELPATGAARLTSKAEVINELEDLQDVRMSFVTGYPNLAFSGVDDPLGMRGDLAAFLRSLRAPAGEGDVGSQVMRQSIVMSNDADGSGPGYSTEPLTGQSREEMFFYERPGVTLARGERAYYPLATQEVPCEHVYELTLEDGLLAQDREAPQEVWHNVRLTNTGATPWTTGPVMITQQGELLAQDLLNYADAGRKTTVRITKALDLQATAAEQEVDRKRGAATFGGWAYDLVQVRGRVEVTSYKARDVVLTVNKRLSGEVVSSAPAARVEATARGLKAVNPSVNLAWELPVKARGQVTIEYAYRLYVRP
jgi:hypothetical protein